TCLLAVLASPSYAWFSFFKDTSYAKTRYPIVLAHGMAGFDNIGPLDYWYGIPGDLRSRGASVQLTHVYSFQSSEVRGEQLLQQVQEILAITAAQRVNLVGHNINNQSVLHVAAAKSTRIAAITSVGDTLIGPAVAVLLVGVSDVA